MPIGITLYSISNIKTTLTKGAIRGITHSGIIGFPLSHFHIGGAFNYSPYCAFSLNFFIAQRSLKIGQITLPGPGSPTRSKQYRKLEFCLSCLPELALSTWTEN